MTLVLGSILGGLGLLAAVSGAPTPTGTGVSASCFGSPGFPGKVLTGLELVGTVFGGVIFGVIVL